MPQYKLYYFNGKARAETTRMLFNLADQAFDDIRIDMEEEWPEFKKTCPFGQLPVLEIDGKRYIQSNAFGRMLARRFGFAGKTLEEEARADMIVDCMEELWPKHRQTSPMYEENDNEAIRLAKLKQYEEETLPLYLERLETLLKENNGGDGWFVGDGITWADLTVYNGFSYITNPSVKYDLDKVPKFKALFSRIEAHPKIAAWIQKRPKNDF